MIRTNTMSQLDNIPPIRRPKGNPVYGDPFRSLDDSFRITTPEPDMLPTKGGAAADSNTPQDENSEADHPFAIQIEITAQTPSSKSWSADVTVLAGKYKTDGDTEYTAAEVTQSFTTSSGTIKPYVYLFIPLTPKVGGGWMAITGGEIRFGANRPVAVWPQVYRSDSGYATSVQIGAWTIQVANISGGVATYGYRAVINQIIAEDYVLKPVKLVTEADPFEPTPTSGAATVTFEPGIILNAGRNISPTVGGGSTMATTPRPTLTITTSGTIYLEATVDAAGTATAIDTKNAATTPTDTSTLKYLTLADVTLAGSVVTVTDRPVRETRNLFVCNGTAIWG